MPISPPRSALTIGRAAAARSGHSACVDAGAYAEVVQPFYLDMMRTNAAQNGSALVPAIVDVGRRLAAADVIAMLGITWRQAVMGAWFALLHDDARVTSAVLDALTASHGSLDSPPLVTAAVVLAGQDALPTLAAYAANDGASAWGACGFAAAAIKYLCGTPSSCLPGEDEREEFSALLNVANQLRAAR